MTKKRRPTISPAVIGWQKSMNKIMMMKIYLTILNLIWTVTMLRTHIPCRVQILKNTLSLSILLLLLGLYYLAGADVHLLKTTGRKVLVTGIDDHELPGLDIAACVALIEANHEKVNLLMHEYAYYGRGNNIHSPTHIEWFQNEYQGKSHHVGAKRVINFLHGNATPLECRSGLMCMSLLGKPTDHFVIRYRTEEPNYPDLPVQEHDWSRTVYGNVKEEVPTDIPNC